MSSFSATLASMEEVASYASQTLPQALGRLRVALEDAFLRASRDLGLTAQQAELLCAHAGDAERLDQRRDLAQLARIVGGDDQPVADRPHAIALWPVAFSWAAKISEQPMRARRSNRSKPSSS